MTSERRTSRTIVVDSHRKMTIPISAGTVQKTPPLTQRRMSKQRRDDLKISIPPKASTPGAPKSPTVERRMSKNLPFVVIHDNTLKDAHMEEIIASFELIDLNSDGRISKGELLKAAALLGMNPTEEDAQAMLSLADLDGDGFINFEEYKHMMKHNYIEIDLEKERLLAAFRVLDRDKDGFLSQDELRAALTFKAPPENLMDVEQFILDADVNGDGQIDYSEFVNSQLCTKIFA
ncbi:Calmodulin [Mizuhopecten yessoensis]|uniref:Calmodulin n=1 Tax=Mizuhopecten yessoensis TaxID=6573 RepID=A0A210R2W5_MIZYE|nr:Calmodulin [Mizuhopecten yessoensis]